jgi:CheY-like chemotaxis protein
MAETRHRVLVVDDHPDATDIMCRVLQLLGHDATGLTCGARVLETIDALAPTVVFLDIGLPDISGYELARALRTRGGAVPHLVAITGWGAAADRARALEAGFDQFLVKPVDASCLQEVLRRAS